MFVGHNQSIELCYPIVLGGMATLDVGTGPPFSKDRSNDSLEPPTTPPHSTGNCNHSFDQLYFANRIKWIFSSSEDKTIEATVTVLQSSVHACSSCYLIVQKVSWHYTCADNNTLLTSKQDVHVILHTLLLRRTSLANHWLCTISAWVEMLYFVIHEHMHCTDSIYI